MQPSLPEALTDEVEALLWGQEEVGATRSAPLVHFSVATAVLWLYHQLPLMTVPVTHHLCHQPVQAEEAATL